MGSLVRATNLWGYGDLVRELGVDPQRFCCVLGFPAGVEHQEDAFISFGRVRSHARRQLRRFELSGLRTSPFTLAGPGHPRTRRGDRAERSHLVRRVGDDSALPIRPFPRVDADGRTAHRADWPQIHLCQLSCCAFPMSSRDTSSAWPSWSGSFVCWAVRRHGFVRFLSRTINRVRTRRTAKRWNARCASDRRGVDSRCLRA